MVKKKKELSAAERQRNNNFAAAFDYLKRFHGITTQGDLAKAMGVNKDTITNILRFYTPVTEDKISKLMAAFDGMFNIQYLRGESDTMLARDVAKAPADIVTPVAEPAAPTAIPEPYASIIAAKDETIILLRHQLKKLEETAERELADKDSHLATVKQQLEDLRIVLHNIQNGNPLAGYPFKIGVADDGDKPSPRQQK